MIDDPEFGREFDRLSKALRDLAMRHDARAVAIIVAGQEDVMSSVAGCDCDGCLGAMTRALADGMADGANAGPHDCSTGGAVH